MRKALCAAVLMVAGCAGKQVPIEQIPTLTKLSDVMDAQAGAADPQFKKSTQAQFTDEEFASLVDSARKLQATSARLSEKQFSKGAEFDALGKQLNENAGALLTAAEGKNAQGARDALVAMKNTCKTCHKKFK